MRKILTHWNFEVCTHNSIWPWPWQIFTNAACLSLTEIKYFYRNYLVNAFKINYFYYSWHLMHNQLQAFSIHLTFLYWNLWLVSRGLSFIYRYLTLENNHLHVIPLLPFLTGNVMPMHTLHQYNLWKSKFCHTIWYNRRGERGVVTFFIYSVLFYYSSTKNFLTGSSAIIND